MPSNGKRRHPSRRLRSCFDRLESRIALSGFYVSPAGDDAAAGTVDAPWKTVQRAVASAAPGDVINLRAGTYAGGVFVDKPDITIQSFPGERATLVAPAYALDRNNLWFYAAGGKALDLDLRGGLLRGEVREGRRPRRRLQDHRHRLLRDQDRPRGRPTSPSPGPRSATRASSTAGAGSTTSTATT